MNPPVFEYDEDGDFSTMTVSFESKIPVKMRHNVATNEVTLTYEELIQLTSLKNLTILKINDWDAGFLATWYQKIFYNFMFLVEKIVYKRNIYKFLNKHLMKEE